MLSSLRWPAAFFAAVLFAAGCAAPERVTTAPPAPEAPQTQEAPAAQQAERPLPGEITAPLAFRQAIEAETRTARGVPGPDYWINTAEYTLEAQLFPDEKELHGTGRIVYHNNSPDTLTTLHLELVQNIHAPGAVRSELMEVTGGVEIERIVLGGQEIQTNRNSRPLYQVFGTQLILAPEAPVPPGATTEIAVDWSFEIPQAGAGGRMGYSGPEEGDADLFFLAYWYPVMSVYDDVVGWYTDQFMGVAEFYAGFADYDLTIKAPRAWTVMATGALQNPEAVLSEEALERMRRAYGSDAPVMISEPGTTPTAAAPDTLTWHFEADQVRDVAFSATRDGYWEAARTPVGDRDGDEQTEYTHINTFWRPEAPFWSEVTRYQQHSITFLSDYTGFPYPWPHMTAVEGAGIIGGGMEFPMMTLMGDYNAAGDTALYNVTAHELAHMWVPMIVSTNERRYTWIDEGMTSFQENQARQDFFPDVPDRRDADVQEQANYLAVARADLEGEIMRRSDYHYTGIAYGTASYSKPATMLVALRGLLGPATFHEALQGFIDAWAYKHPYPQDFFNAFEAAHGEDLDWFWDSFYYETWTLDQAITSVEPTEDGVRVTVEDEGLAPMPVDLTLTLESGETVTERIPVDVWLEGRRTATVTVDTSAPVERVVIDAERAFPDIDRSDNVWTRTGATTTGS